MLRQAAKVLALATLIITAASAQTTRFINPIFPVIDSSRAIPFAIAKDYMGLPDTLLLDYYGPSATVDTMKHRPLIIVIHGGSFTGGVRDDGFCLGYEKYFAAKGYSTASIDYRLGIDTSIGSITIINPANMLAEIKQAIQIRFGAAVYRSIQDAHSAVRFFKANADLYKVDTSKIFLCGYSAGAVTAIQYAHMQISEFIKLGDTTGLGALDIGDNLTVSPSIKGYISYAGSIFDSSWLAAGDAPFIAFHGTNDAILPYNSGSPYGNAMLPVIYGSNPLHIKADQLGIYNKLITYTDSTHAFAQSPTLLPLTFDSAALFLYPIINGTSVKHQYASKFNNKVFKFNNFTQVQNYCLNGRQFGSANKSSNVYISNFRNLDRTSLTSKSIILKH